MNGLIQSAKQIEKLKKIALEQKKQDEKFMRLALKQAQRAFNDGEIPVGAIIVKDGKVIARAYNKKEQKDCAIFHAEILAIIAASKKLGWRLDGCEMYVNLEPCLMCSGAIISARIKRLVFGMHEQKSGCFESKKQLLLGDSGLNHSVEIQSGILQQECENIWRKFFEQKRK
ncbi:MAG: nucleoside deaminase [Clostridia bacterium]|nr:nucleoside deaminase [Clostridia bacterium]